MINLVILFKLYLIMWHVDSSEMDFNFPYKKMEIFNSNGNIDIEYIPLARFSLPYLWKCKGVKKILQIYKIFKFK